MSRVHDLKRRSLIFGGATVVLVGLLVFRGSPVSTQTTEDLPALAPGFTSASAATIELRQAAGGDKPGEPAKAVRLVRRRDAEGAESWVVASAFDYPANETSVSRLLSELAKGRVAAESTRREEAFADYAQDGRWTDLTIQDAQGKELVALGVGKHSWQTSETNVLLRRDGPPRVVRVRNFGGDSASTRPEAWFESRMFPGLESDHVESIEVVQKVEVDGKPTTRRLAVVRRPEEPAPAPEPGKPPPLPPERGWDMTSPEQVRASREDVDNLVRAFTGLLFLDVVAQPAGAEEDAKHGFDAPEVVATVTLPPEQPNRPGRKLGLTLGKFDPEKKVWTARRAGARWVFTVSDNETVGRFRNDPAKYKETPKPTAPKEPAKDGPKEPAKDGPKEPAKDGAPPAPADLGSPDGPPKEGAPKEAPPKEPAPAEPKPGEPAPAEPKPGEPKPGEPPPAPPKSPEPPEKPGASK